MNPCDICKDVNYDRDCEFCTWGNPCYGCEDYDFKEHKCKSDGACADTGK